MSVWYESETCALFMLHARLPDKWGYTQCMHKVCKISIINLLLISSRLHFACNFTPVLQAGCDAKMWRCITKEAEPTVYCETLRRRSVISRFDETCRKNWLHSQSSVYESCPFPGCREEAVFWRRRLILARQRLHPESETLHGSLNTPYTCTVD